MPRARNPKIDEACALYSKGIELKEISSRLGVPPETVRSWKNRYKWKCNATQKKNATLQKIKPIAKETKSVLENPDLTDEQRLFCLYYSKSFNATQSYLKAYGCSYATALTNGPALLGNARVKDEVTRLKKERYSKAFLSEEDIFQKYMDIAFSDLGDYVAWRQEEVPVIGAFGPIETEDDETGEKTVLTKNVNVVRFKDSSQVDTSVISEVKQGKDGASIKLQDRMRALQWLTDHMDMGTAEQRARVSKLKAEAANIRGEHEGGAQDDGFIDALRGEVKSVWEDEK